MKDYYCHICEKKLGRVCQFYEGHFYCPDCREDMFKTNRTDLRKWLE